MDTLELLLDSHRGIYIPQHFAQEYRHASFRGIDDSDWDVLLGGPDEEWYWEAWSNVLDHAECIESGYEGWTLYQDGDLWLVSPDHEWEEV